MGSEPLSKLKKKLDKVFSLYIRSKYPKNCYTCGRTNVVLQCGHFISRNHLITRWNENNCRPQCVGCNIWGGGKPLDFEENLKAELGDNVVEEMKHSRHTILKMTPHDYQTLITKYDTSRRPVR